MVIPGSRPRILWYLLVYSLSVKLVASLYLSNLTMEAFVDKYLNPETYRPYVRPGVNEGVPVIVYVDMYIASVSSIDEMNMDFTVTMYFRQRWVDPRLTFTELDHHVPLNYNLFPRIWVPDINFKNMKVGSFRDITVPNRLLYVYPTGEVYYSQGLNLQLECSMDLSKYPMDTQSCQIKLGSFGYTEEDIIVEWRNISHPVQTADDFELAEFRFTGVTFGDCTKSYVTGTFSCRNATLSFERKFVYYLIQVYIPSVLVVILSWVAFWIDIDAVPARISLGLLTVLTMTTQVSGMTSRQPRVSYIKALDVWMTTCLVFVFGSLVEYCIVNVVYRREKRQKEETIARLSSLVGVANGAFLVAQHASETDIQPNEQNRMAFGNRTKETTDDSQNPSVCSCGGQKSYPPGYAQHLEVISRYIFPAMFLVFNIFYWVSYKLIV